VVQEPAHVDSRGHPCVTVTIEQCWDTHHRKRGPYNLLGTLICARDLGLVKQAPYATGRLLLVTTAVNYATPYRDSYDPVFSENGDEIAFISDGSGLLPARPEFVAISV
jgi:hypothetical protein